MYVQQRASVASTPQLEMEVAGEREGQPELVPMPFVPGGLQPQELQAGSSVPAVAPYSFWQPPSYAEALQNEPPMLPTVADGSLSAPWCMGSPAAAATAAAAAPLAPQFCFACGMRFTRAVQPRQFCPSCGQQQ